ncbi:MAG: hypothetical protein Kow0069_07320 [Promethearchaeota archaeon]
MELRSGSERVPENVSEETKASLKAIGLTEYEINIYLALVAKGPMNARDLAEASTVPYSRIYNILQLLEDRGFIIKEEESRPSRYFAKSPDEALVFARHQHQEEFNRHAEKILQELTPIYQQKDTPIKIALYVLRGKESCITRLHGIMKNTQQSFYIASSDLEMIQELSEELLAMRARGIREIRVLLEERAVNDPECSELVKKLEKVAAVRTRDQMFGTGVVRDDGEDAFVILTRSFFEDKKSYFGIITDHLAFGPAAADYFEYLYQTATPLEEMLEKRAGDGKGNKNGRR